jgi:hypothetical protein
MAVLAILWQTMFNVDLEAFDAKHEHFTTGTAQGIRRWADRGRAL